MVSFFAKPQMLKTSAGVSPSQPPSLVVDAYLDPGDGLLRLHHPGGLGWLALAHQLGGAEVAGAEENSLYQNFGVSDGTCGQIRALGLQIVSDSQHTQSEQGPRRTVGLRGGLPSTC